MHKSLVSAGLTPSADPEHSDYHLINTCTFIQKATEETIQTILNAAQIKKETGQKLIVAGCFAERYPNEIRTDLPEVDLAFGTGRYQEVGDIFRENFPELKDIAIEFNGSLQERLLSADIENYSKPFAYVKVSDGCNRGCGFCIIPNLRGSFREIEFDSIRLDVESALQAGAKEICLVSQDTVSYGRSADRFLDMVRKVSEIPGLDLLRLLYLYPDKKTEKLLPLFGELENLAPYLESPLQHVSEKVLRSMNRSGGYNYFRDLYAKAREIRPDLEIRTSFILGYPGETEEDVEELIRFLKETKPEKVNLFSFSPQTGSPAEKIAETVSEEEKADRINRVRSVYLDLLTEIHQDRIGKEYPCIVDSAEEGSTVVRRFQDAPEIDEVVFVEGVSLQPGTFGRVRIDSFYEFDMLGTWKS